MPYHDDDHAPPHLARHVDAWIRGDDNILLISGLSGAGKSVFARTLARQHAVPYQSLDRYLRQHLIDQIGPFSKPEYPVRMREHGLALIRRLHPHDRIILEGGQLLWLDPAALSTTPYILLQTSWLTSTCRAMARDFEAVHYAQYGRILPLHWVKTNARLWAHYRAHRQSF